MHPRPIAIVKNDLAARWSLTHGPPTLRLKRMLNLACPPIAAPDIIAHMQHTSGSRCCRKQRIEGGDPPGVSRGNAKTLADIAKPALRNPTHTALERVQRRDEFMPAIPNRFAAGCSVGIPI
jgi:hypothetical protein